MSDAFPFVCPRCRGRLLTGVTLCCELCGSNFPTVGKVMRFVPSEKDVGNFGFQWNRHPTTQLDQAPGGASERFFVEATGWSPSDLRGRRILDAGCGAGRYSEVANRWGGEVVAVDLSASVDACAANLSGRGVTVAQADIMDLPLADETFDLVFSLGVIHHTPDARMAFHRLARLLRPGGSMAVWVYNNHADSSTRMRLTAFYRRLSWRLPTSLLYALCHVAVPWHYANRLPLIGSVSSRLLHVSEHPDWRWRVLDTFDWYSPRYQSHHDYPEVFRWFSECGLEVTHLGYPPVSVMGRRRATS